MKAYKETRDSVMLEVRLRKSYNVYLYSYKKTLSSFLVVSWWSADQSINPTYQRLVDFHWLTFLRYFDLNMFHMAWLNDDDDDDGVNQIAAVVVASLTSSQDFDCWMVTSIRKKTTTANTTISNNTTTWIIWMYVHLNNRESADSMFVSSFF